MSTMTVEIGFGQTRLNVKKKDGLKAHIIVPVFWDTNHSFFNNCFFYHILRGIRKAPAYADEQPLQERKQVYHKRNLLNSGGTE